MRLTLRFGMILCCLAALTARGPSSASAQRLERELVSRHIPHPAKPPVFKRDVEGYGQTEDDAREQALDNACTRITEYLADTYHETSYKPSVAYLQELRVLPSVKDIEATDKTFENLPTVKKVATVQVEVSTESLKRLREQARQQRVDERQHWLGFGLAGVVALLLVSIGYLRMEEAMKGFYTGLLRAGALGLLTLVGAILWYWM